LLELVIKSGEGGVREGGSVFSVGRIILAAILLDPAGMFMIMTVETQQLPVTTVRRIMVVVVIPVVHRQLTQLFAFEITGTAATDMGEELQRPLTVASLSYLFSPTQLSNDHVSLFGNVYALYL